MMARLAATLPSPPSAMESVFLAGRLANFCVGCGLHLHAVHHSTDKSTHCHFDAHHQIWPPLRGGHGPAFTLRMWLVRYLRAFDAAHASASLPVRIARYLRARRHRPVTLDELCRAVGASCSAVKHAFTARYGLSPATYHTRVRLRFVVDVLGRSEKVDSAASRAGYCGQGSFYTIFQQHTGIAPAHVRKLSANEREALIAARLETRVAVLRQRVKAESRKPKAESRKPKAESRKPKADHRRSNALPSIALKRTPASAAKVGAMSAGVAGLS